MNTKAYAFFLKKNRPRRHNPVVLDLNDGPYHQRVVKNKKVYKRKNKWQDTETEHSEVS